MLRTTTRSLRTLLRPLRTPSLTHALHSSSSRSSSSSSSPPAPLPVDDLCLPLSPPYSISEYLPSPSHTPSLSRETLLKLHRLAALEPPSSEQAWRDLEDLNELVAIVQAVRDVDTTALGLKEGEMVDARVRAEAEPVDWEKKKGVEVWELTEEGKELLKLAEKTEGGYFVAPMPENVKRRKKSAASSEEVLSVDEY
ncbi:hypothetical protein JCM8547_004944 [Rhodosporidiobolus lusitaniae]